MQEKSTGLDIIIRHLDNPQEERLKKDVELFCSLSAENEILFKEIEAIWHAGSKVALLSQINASKSAGHFQEILSRNLNAKHANLWRPLLYAVAAVFLVLGFYAAFLIAREDSDGYIYQTDSNKIDSVKLTDGSLIILSGNFWLGVPFNFKKAGRGGAYIKDKGIFQISEDVNRPFKVSLRSSSGAVWGTLFNIKKDNLRVGEGVKSGEILFTPLEARQVFLLKTKRGVNYDIKNNIVAETLVANVGALQTKNLVFPDSPLEDVFRQLSRHYGISFALTSSKEGYREKKWNAAFANNHLDKALDILKLIYGFNVCKQSNHNLRLINQTLIKSYE